MWWRDHTRNEREGDPSTLMNVVESTHRNECGGEHKYLGECGGEHTPLANVEESTHTLMNVDERTYPLMSVKGAQPP
jgi:hypothetical protein